MALLQQRQVVTFTESLLAEGTTEEIPEGKAAARRKLSGTLWMWPEGGSLSPRGKDGHCPLTSAFSQADYFQAAVFREGNGF